MPKKETFSPGRAVLFAMFFTIFIGTILLMLPVSQSVPIDFIDCFFTSTSSACVAGVLTVPFQSFSFVGQCIILALVQIGGLGLVTLAFFLVSLFTNLGVGSKLVVGEILELESWQKTQTILIFIVKFTIIAELIGAFLIYHIISPADGPYSTVFYALFHSVSSFCSAGLSCFGNNLVAFKNNPAFLMVTATLILCGTLGFSAWYEIIEYIKNKYKHKRVFLSLTTKVILSTTSLLVAGTVILLFLLESKSNFSQDSWFITILNMLFNTISYRSTGFSTIDISNLQSATLFLIIMYSFIGSSPESTGSGIKVTTFSIFVATIKSVISGRSAVELKGRTIPQDQIFKSIAILSLSFFWIIVSTFILLLLESNKTFIDIFFETVSSFTTLGIARNVTLNLSTAGKFLVALNMYIGRLGSLSFLLALRARRKERTEFSYPEERIMIS